MNTRKIARSMALAMALTMAASSAVAGAPEAGHWKAANSLEGSWRVTIIPYDCVSGQDAPFSFYSFLTFAAGGTVSETTSNPFFQPGQRSVGSGYWERTGPNYYHAVVEAFIQFTVTPPLPPPTPPYVRGTQRLEQGIELRDADHWVSLAEVTFFDPSGTVVPPTGCARASAERMR